jgi:hypothetical protein
MTDGPIVVCGRALREVDPAVLACAAVLLLWWR